MQISNISGIAKVLAQHYEQHKRDLPWRLTNDPYLIWVSEVILQQTRVDQGLPYYNKFIVRFPNVATLAKAEQEEVLKYWQGLGYYSRARNMHAAAQQVLSEHHGLFPSKYTELLKLKGIGTYTAAAIASICSNESVATVDGNVLRVLSRIFGIDEPIDGTKGKKEFQHLADELLDRKDPGTHNQALMEFGALTCVPRNPECGKCPLNNECLAFKNDRVALLPVKLKKIKKRTRHFHYFDVRANGHIWLQQRTAKDIWQNMYELPLIEFDGPVSTEHALASFLKAFNLPSNNFTLIRSKQPIKHVLTHQLLLISFTYLSISAELLDKTPAGIKIYSSDRQAALPKPKPIAEHLENFNDQSARSMNDE